MRSLQIRDERKPGIPASFIHKGALCNFNSSRLVSIHSVLHLRRGRFTTNAKLAPQSSVLCIGLIFLSPPPKNSWSTAKQMVADSQTPNKTLTWRRKPLVSCRSSRAFYGEAEQQFLGRRGRACWQLPGQICVSTEFCAALAKFRVPSGPEMCAVFCFPRLPRAGRGIKPHPERGHLPAVEEDLAWRC